MDNARDYFHQVLTPYFQKEGMLHESSCVNTSQQNGVAERKNGHLLETTHALMFTKMCLNLLGEKQFLQPLIL